MLKQLDAITDPTIRERLERLLIKGVIGTKLFLGVGLTEETNREKYADEIFKDYRRPPVYLKVKVFEKDEIWSADLVDMPKENLGRGGKYRYILTIIDLFTRYAWGIPLKTKTGSEVKQAFESIFRSNRKPSKLWVDRGKEFYNKTMDSFLKQNNIELYSTNNEGKACVVERLNRTLKQFMWKKFLIQGNQKWVKILPSVLEYYNNKIHSSTRMSPIEASKYPAKIKETITNNNYENEDNMTKRQNKPKIKVGQKVIVYKWKNHFEKGYTAKWSTEVFKISRVLLTSPVTYEVKALDGEEILGRWYQNELQKSEF
jgi:hypothetical protein